MPHNALKLGRVAATLVFLLVFFSLGARAELLSMDGPFGTDTLTLDTATGLVWLDLDLTAGRSFNNIESQLVSGGEFEGYRFATRDEVLALWNAAAIPDITFEGPIQSTDFTAANLAPAQALANLLGVTLESPFGPLSEGFTDTAPVGDDAMRIVGELNICVETLCLFVFPNQIDVALASLGPNTKGKDEVINYIGSYLIQTATADPVGGEIAQTFNQFAVCRNLTDPQTVVIAPLGQPSWDCTANALTAAPGDEILQVVRSIATCGPGNPCNVTGSVSGVEGLLAVCRNLTTGQTQPAVVTFPDFDCGAAGFGATSGDNLLLILRGTSPAP